MEVGPSVQGGGGDRAEDGEIITVIAVFIYILFAIPFVKTRRGCNFTQGGGSHREVDPASVH